jgi:uncharacterized phage protein (TIGR01671 family)
MDNKDNNFGIGKRAIKFRAWDKDGGMKHITSFLSFGRTGEFSSVEDNEDVVLMQFTGLLDKNGKEIYEGDITSLHCGVVTFDEGSFGIEYKDRFDEATSCELIFQNKHVEVIGNVFDNPELING